MAQLALTVIVFLPLLGALALALVPKSRAGAAKWIAASFMAVDLLLTVGLVAAFDRASGAMQFVVDVPWVAQAGIHYHLGVDGISLAMLFLSALLGLLAVVASWKTTDRAPAYFAMLLLLQVGMNGVFGRSTSCSSTCSGSSCSYRCSS
jgi:NADH-quinone oxidoreductase subunit M